MRNFILGEAEQVGLVVQFDGDADNEEGEEA
jgi:hypothetical protein